MRNTLAAIALLALAPSADDKDWVPPKTSNWIEARTASFTVYSRANPSATEKIVADLERFRQSLGRVTRGFALDTRLPTSIVVFPSAAAIGPYLVDPQGKKVNAVGLFQPGPVHNWVMLDGTAGADPQRVVYHEYLHAVFGATLGELPLWLNEGLAEYYSTFQTRNAGREIQIGHPIEHHVLAIKAGRRLPWKNVFLATSNSEAYNDESQQDEFYAQSWLAVHFLMSTDERAKSLGRFLSALREGSDPEPAFTAALGMDPAAFAAQVEEYAKQGSAHIVWKLGEEAPEVEVALRSLGAAEVLYRLGDLVAHVGPMVDARRHLAAARGAGWAAAAIETSLGVAASRVPDGALLEQHMREAIRLGTKSAEAYLLLAKELAARYYGRSDRERSASTPPEVIEIRGLLETALEYSPDPFSALVALAQTYVEEPDPSPGITRITRARELRPLDLYALRTQACLVARSGNPASAWELIERGLVPRNPPLADDAASCAASAATMAAHDRLTAEDREGATRIVREARSSFRRSVDQAKFAALDRALTGDGTHVLVVGDSATIEAVNEAIDLANAGQLDPALAQLDGLVAGCASGPLCDRARRMADEIRATANHNRQVKSYNEAIGLANTGKNREALAILRGLAGQVNDPGLAADVAARIRDLEQ